MPKIQQPFGGLSAAGSFGNQLTYQKKGKGSAVYVKTKPGDKKPFTPSGNQYDCRILNALIKIRWSEMSQGEKDVFNDEVIASKLKMSGWNLFYKRAFADPYTYLALVAGYTGNILQNGQIKDISGNGLHQTLKPTPPDNCPQIQTTTRKKRGKTIYFDGSNDYSVGVADPKSNISDYLSIVAVIRNTDFTQAGGVLCNGSRNYDFRVGIVRVVSLGFYDVNNVIRSTSSLTPLPLNQSNVIGVVFKPDSYSRWFLNGKLDVVRVLASSMRVANQPIYLGRENLTGATYGYYKGQADNIFLFHRLLPDTEMIKIEKMLMEWF